MNPAAFPEANRVFRKPATMTDEECGSLHVHDTGEALLSCWEPTIEERIAIAAGGPIWLSVLGRGHPPVFLSGSSPFAPARPLVDEPPLDPPWPDAQRTATELMRYIDNAKAALGDRRITGRPLDEAIRDLLDEVRELERLLAAKGAARG